MKVPASVRRLFDDQKEKNDLLKDQVDKRITGLKKPRWHYESRTKELVSFALKLESGRFKQPDALEDFFACTIVVANMAEVGLAEQLIKDHFNVTERRPRDDARTHKASNAFLFDDLRLYVTLGQNPALPPSELNSIKFEIQIKTFLQHAWSIATHDLVYKTDDANWSKERIAFQTKAMLEHAEISIQQAEVLAGCATLAKEDEETKQTKETIALLKKQWQSDELPPDIRRLAQNIRQLQQGMQISLTNLEAILNAGKAARGGTHPANLSPYASIIQYLFAAEKDRLIRMLESKDRRPVRVLIPTEIDIPIDIEKGQLTNAIFV